MNDFARQLAWLGVAKVIQEVVSKHIYPFDPGFVEFYVFRNLDRNLIRVTSTTFEEDVIIDGRSLYLMPSELSMALWVGEQAGAYFASLMNEPVPDTIVLGEN